MRTYRAKSGPFAEQPFYRPDEVEAICLDELHKLNLCPATPSPIRIDRFIEKRFGIVPTYEDLPKGLLGFTRFGASGVEEIFVSRAFDDEGTRSAERRLRTTLAHEGGHGLLHAHLFALGTSPGSLFGDGLAKDAPKILCRDGGVPGSGSQSQKTSPYRWWEYQANLAMGALLLPGQLVEKAVEPMLSYRGLLNQPVLENGQRDSAIRFVAETFDVNPIVARIRLEGLYPPALSDQLSL